MILILSFVIAMMLRRRYVYKDDPWTAKAYYLGCCLCYTPLFGIPFFKLTTGFIRTGLYSRITNPDRV